MIASRSVASGRPIDTTELARRARSVLELNRRGAWTCPSVSLYPHQWLWDSCFVAIGLARVDPARAAGELRALFRGQWANGMLPHMLFADDVPDVGSTRIWQSRRNPLAPRDIETSCITQPPVTAIATLRVAQALAPDDRATFLGELFPKLVAADEWLYRERDPDGCGLVTLIHPWECGLDTTPPWMQAMAPHAGAVVGTGRDPLPSRPCRAVPPARHEVHPVGPAPDRRRGPADARARATREASRLRAAPHATRSVGADPGPGVQFDPRRRQPIVDRDRRRARETALPPELPAHFARTTAALEELWDEDAGEYYSRDAVSGELLRTSTIATFLPLFAGVPTAEARPPAARTTPTAQRVLAALPGTDGPHRRARVPRRGVLEGPDLVEHELDDRRGARRARRARPRR